MAERTKKKLIYPERCHELTPTNERVNIRPRNLYLLDYNFLARFGSIEVKIRIHYILRYILKKEAFIYIFYI